MDKLDQLSEESEHEIGGVYQPSPLDFVEYVPWACCQLQMEEEVIITKEIQSQYVSILIQNRIKSKTSIRNTQKQSEVFHFSPVQLKEISSVLNEQEFDGASDVVKIISVYRGDQLVQIKFEKDQAVPRLVLKVIGLIIQFHVHVDTIKMGRGIDKYSVYELSKLLPMSNITDVCLDGAYVAEGNYFILLEKPAHMRYLSLSRCGIDDRQVYIIATKLAYPMPASSVLALLNLSTNRITDKGAKYLATALRSNRHLNYLNLAGNMLSDKGAAAILDSLKEFSLTSEEIMSHKKSHIVYLKNLEIAKAELRDDLRNELQKNPSVKKSLKTVGKILVKDIENQRPNSSNIYMSPDLNDKVDALARRIVGEFHHPFSNEYVNRKYGEIYSLGNNILCNLNIAYNNLTYLTLKKLLVVIEYQKSLGRKPNGLITVTVEGNPMPIFCNELVSIEHLLQSPLTKRRESSPRKRTQSIVVKRF